MSAVVYHVKVGHADLGDGNGPWIPTDKDLAEIEKAVTEKLQPLGANRVIVTHFGVHIDTFYRQ